MPTTADADSNYYISSYFGGAVGFGMPLLFTFLTYNDKCKIGIAVDTTFVKYQQKLKQCWCNQWTKFYHQSTKNAA